MRASQVNWHLASNEHIQVNVDQREGSYWLTICVMRKADYGNERVAEVALFCEGEEHQGRVLDSIIISAQKQADLITDQLLEKLGE